MKLSKVGIFLASIYLMVVLYAVGYLVYRINFMPVHSEFAGLGLIILTLPWSVLLLKVIEVPDSIILSISILSGLAVVNAFILYMVGQGIEIIIRKVAKQKETKKEDTAP